MFSRTGSRVHRVLVLLLGGQAIGLPLLPTPLVARSEALSPELPHVFLDTMLEIFKVVTSVRGLWTLLSGWWRNSDRKAEYRSSEPTRQLYIVRHRWRYEAFKLAVGNGPNVEVVRDRRHGERRRGIAPPRVDRRKQERRSLNIDGSLLRKGWAVVMAS